MFSIQNIKNKKVTHNKKIRTDAIATALETIPVEELIEFAKGIGAACDNLPRSFGATLKHHRKRTGMTQEDLAWEAGLDVGHIGCLENDKVERPSQQVIAELGRALKLPGMFTEDMMNKAGCPLNRDLPEDMHLKTVIYFMYMRSREECNALLKLCECKPIGGRKKKSSKVS